MENAGRILLMPKGDYSASTTYAMLDIVNHSGASWVCKQACTGQTPSDSNTAYWQRFGTAVDLSNFLLKSGGGMVSSEDYEVLSIRNTKYTHSIIGYRNYESALGWLGFRTKDTPTVRTTDGAFCDLLHTGNKPTGTYTGNGDDTSRQITIGGIGNLVYISDTHYLNNAIIGKFGGIAWSYLGGNVRTIPSGEASFLNGTLSISSKDVAINNNGIPHDYQVL